MLRKAAFAMFAAVGFAYAMPAAAATQVSGPVTQNATWTVAGSPYVLTGDVTIESGASVGIEPGVRVLMNAGANLRVVAGALSAQGTGEAPIVVTSAKDVAGSGATAQPGDWGRLVFEDGTNDANTVLAHVQVRYGGGIAISAASPRIDDTDISHNMGAAITIDLASSPVGRNLSAGGNAINGIVVPAGVVVGDVAWRLKGIPYVVREGIVDIGLPPFALTSTQMDVAVGASVDLGVVLRNAARGDYVVTLASGNPAVATVAASAVVAAGTSNAVATIAGIAPGNTTITATHAASGTERQANVNVVAQPWLTLSSINAPIRAGTTASLSVSRSDASSALTIALDSSDLTVATVPASVMLEPGQSSAAFDVAGIDEGHAMISASAPGHVAAATTVAVEHLHLVAPASLSLLANTSASLTLSLSKPAPDGGVTVSIANDRADALDAPASVTIAAGETSADVALRASVTATATLAFSADGYEPAQTIVWIVSNLVPRLGDAGDALWLAQGMTFTAPVRLSAPAPAGGVTIALSSLVPGVADITPAEVTITAGAMASTATVTVRGVAAGETRVRLAAVNMAGVENEQSIRVGTKVRLRVDGEPGASSLDANDKIGLGLRESISVDLVDEYGWPVRLPFAVEATLTSGDVAKLGVGPSVTIAANASGATAYVDALAVTTAPVALGARSATAGVGEAAPRRYGVVVPELTFSGLGDYVQAVGRPHSFYVNLSPRGTLAGTGRSVSLDIVDASPSNIVNGLYSDTGPITSIDRPGQYWTGAATASGRFKVRASMPGVGSVTSREQVVVESEFRVSESTSGFGSAIAAVTVGAGLQTELVLSIYVGGNLSTGGDRASLTSSDPSRVQVSESAIWMGDYASIFQLRGIAPTASGQPGVVTISDNGVRTLQLPVTVVPRTLVFRDLDGLRSPSSGPDTFSIGWAGSGPPSANEDHLVDVALVPDATPGVLPDPPLATGSGGSPVGVTLRAGWSNVAESLSVASPLAPGSYRLVATLEDGTTVTSPVQTVGIGALHLYGSDIANDNSGTRFLPLGERASTMLTVSLVATRGERTPMTAEQPVTVHLISRAPDWVSVPASVTIAQGESSATFEARGLDVTDGAVAIDAYIGGDATPATTLPVRVFPVELEFVDVPNVRLIDDAPRDVVLQPVVRHPCYILARSAGIDEERKAEPGYDCRIVPTLFERRPGRVEIVNETSPPSVTGFQVGGALGPAAIDTGIDAGATQIGVTVATPAHAGRYRLRATLDEGEPVESVSTTVGMLSLAPSSEWVFRIAPNTRARLLARVVIDGHTIMWNDNVVLDEPATFALACADTAVCTVEPSAIIPAGRLDWTDVWFQVTGAGLGTTMLTASSPRLPSVAPTPVEVVPAKIEVGSGSFGAWSTTAVLNINLVVPNSPHYIVDATQPVVVTLTSTDPSVATAPATVTIEPGQSNWSGQIQKAGSTGTTTIIATAPGFATGISQPVTVTAGGN